MAYDERLAERIRAILEVEPELTEQKMFGGLGFMLGGHMAVAAASRGALMVRCAPADLERHVRAGAAPMEMRGRPMAGWLLVDQDLLRTARQLDRWVQVGVDYVATLPPKTEARPRPH